MLCKRVVFLLINFNVIFGQDYHVKDFNATGDGIADDTRAVRAAMAAAEHSNGGRVIFDDGFIFLTGAFNVTSNVILDVRGRILASQSNDTAYMYPLRPPLPWYGGGTDAQQTGRPERQSFIQSYNATNITLSGGGIIDGQGGPWWHCTGHHISPCNGITRPNFVRFIYTTHLTVHNITLQNSPAWNLHLAWVTDAHIHNITFLSPSDAHNTDGIDIDCSVDVLVENCHYEGSRCGISGRYASLGDDAVAIKSGINYLGRTFGRTSENIFVRNFTVANSPHHCAMSIGSEMSGGVRNVTFQDVTLNNVSYGIRVKSARGRGGFIQDVRFDNFKIYNTTQHPIDFTGYVSSPFNTSTNDTGTPKFKNISITNIYIEGGEKSFYIDGLPESPFRDVILANITVMSEEASRLWSRCIGLDGRCNNSSVIPSCPSCLNAACPNGWIRSSINRNKCYRIHNVTSSWTDPESACQRSSLASLMSIDSAFENADLTHSLGERSYSECQKAYIGLQGDGNSWLWANGDNSTYRNWEADYPTNISNGKCVVLDQKDGKWSNQPCSLPLCFVCSIKLAT